MHAQNTSGWISSVAQSCPTLCNPMDTTALMVIWESGLKSWAGLE